MKNIPKKIYTDDPELINEILTKYHEWASNLPAIRLIKWDYEEVYPDKMKARIRKEFINFLNKNDQNETK